MSDVLSTLTAERVRRDVDVLAHAGLEVDVFLAEVHHSLTRAVPYDAACFALCDPGTKLLTGTFKYGSLFGRDERDHEWGLIEYGEVEETAFAEMARQDVTATALHHSTGGDPHRSSRMRDFIEPYFSLTDELRLVARAGGEMWGGVALFREEAAAPFSASEVDYLASLSTPLAVGLRCAVLARLVGAPQPVDSLGPAVIVVGSDDRVSQISLGAEQRLAQFVGSTAAAAPTGIVASLVARARLYARGLADSPPRSRVRLATGEWFVLHASPLAARDGATGDVVITIEEARPPEIVPLVVAAFGLTPRERDVAQLVLQGVETKEIAAALHMSVYTVQDHLKSIFDKADVRSRRELMARVFFDQYAPRLGQDLAPSGWFLPAGTSAEGGPAGATKGPGRSPTCSVR